MKIEYGANEKIDVKVSGKNLSEEVASLRRAFDFFSTGSFLANPDKVLRKAGKDISAYHEIKSDSHVKACIRSRKAGAKSMLWDIDRGKAKSKHAQFIKHIFQQLPVFSIIDDILEAPLFGYKPLEVYWKKETAGSREAVIPTAVKGKPIEWFYFGENGELLFRSRQCWQGEPVPPKKFLVPRQEPTDNNPYGFPDLSLCFWYYTFKKGGLRFWLQFIEKYGMPFVIGKQPRGTDEAESDALLEALDQMIQDAVAVIPDDSSVELMESAKTSSSAVYKEFLYFLNAEVSKAILGQTLTTEIQDKGTYSAAKVHLEVRDDIIMADVKLVEETFNQLIEWIIELNFGYVPDVPKFIMYREHDIDLDLAQRDQIITNMGYQFSLDYMNKAYFLSDGDIAVREQPQFPSFSESVSAPKNAIEQLDEVLTDEQMQAYLHQVISPVIAMIDRGSDYVEIQNALAKQFPKMNDKDFREFFEKALFVAQTMARLSGKK